MIPVFNPDPRQYADPVGRAARMIAFLERLRLWEGVQAGKLLRLHPFQRAVVKRIYGPVTTSGEPIVRTAAVWMPRGNAKTTLAAGLSLGHFYGPEREAGGQVIAAAADRENAGIAFRCAWQMTKQDPGLVSRVKPVESRKQMQHPGTRSSYAAISSEAYSKHGLNCSYFLADEVHVWPPAEARKLFSTITDSMVKRTHPLTVIISTAGHGTGGLANDLWTYSLKVAAGEIDDPSFAPIIFAAEPTADWHDEAEWCKANPGIDAGFLSIDELRIKARRIEHFPAEIANFKRFHLNIWTEGAPEPWVDPVLYDAAGSRTPAEKLIGRTCYIGVDLASVEDLAGVVAVFPDGTGEARSFDVLAHAFLPEAGLARKSDDDRADYQRWAAQGHLTLTEGNRIDHAAVIAHIVTWARLYGVREVAIDRWNSTAVSTALQKEGLTVVEFGQGFATMAAPMRELKRAILGRQFRHGNNPVLRMCFANAVAVTDDAENEKLSKERANGRIDLAVCAVMGVGRAIANERPPSIFDRPELWGEAANHRSTDVTGDTGTEWSPEILADMRHPLFAEHKRRFEAWQDTQSEDAY